MGNLYRDTIAEDIRWEVSRLPRILPSEAGISPSQIAAFLDGMEKRKVHMHSFRLIYGESVFAEGSYKPCRADDIHTLFSLSKSFTSAAVGFAVTEGLMTVDQPVLDFFKEDTVVQKQAGEHMRLMTVKHLLTMNTGHDDPLDFTFSDLSASWSRDFLLGPVPLEPGSHFLYNTRASYMLSVIVQKVTGQTVFQYLTPRLFQPLGFHRDIWWEISPEGYDCGGFGLNLAVEDIAKFAVLLLNKGSYGGRQILPAAWIEEASYPWSDNSNCPWSENVFGYGYQFWMCHIPGTYRGDGAFGQYCIIVPQLNMALATTAGQVDMQQIANVFWESMVEPLLAEGQESKAAQNSRDMEEGIAARMQKLTLPGFCEENGFSTGRLEIPESALGQTYRLERNPLQIRSVKFERDGRITVTNGRFSDTFEVGLDWMEGRFTLDGAFISLQKYVFRNGLFPHFYVKGCTAWHILCLDFIYPETAYQDTWTIVFDGDKISMRVWRNAYFNENPGFLAEGYRV